jgi:membrane protease YdiL (CAAX protease family)
MRFLVDPSHVRLNPTAWIFLVIVCVLLPVAVVRQHRHLASGMLQVTRMRIYAGAVGTHAVFVLMVWAVTHTGRLDLTPPYRPNAFHVVIGLIALAIGLLPLLERFQLDDPVARERTRLIAPRTGREFVVFYLVSATAGVAEELTYRGLLFTLLAALLGGWWMAALVTASVFGIVHLFQGWKSAGIAALMGLREQLVVGFTGTVLIAIVVHALHDAIAGTVIAVRARHEEGAALAVS